ncbi:hypothetical protein [Bythopirellula polymerisocia]|uniref:PEP-CTERM protein-sorting domain-containing protein n=1 Tax=Bythopirellula polymerisocia TaxID=2528003 RepID=A0A5C6C124_9BACT|nr:hypothetical protein [Bythopirellula polymerisocia]TWU17822.1 hypothetical protein Pla144_50690 [Bythopirellula polymerisocia]
MWLRASAILLAFLYISPSFADDLQLTLDLKNTISNDATSGGTWQLFARKLETGGGSEGDFGVAATRGLLNNIDVNSISFASGIGQPTTGGPYIQTLSNGTVEINYQQDLSGSVVTGVGVNFPVTRDSLIASGTWPSGPRPTFGIDPDGFSSAGSFLSSASAPYSLVSPDNTFTEVVTLGDFNNSATITLLDVAPFWHQFNLSCCGPEPYNPAADINQSGSITSLDRGAFISLFTSYVSPPLDPAPEPTGNEVGRFYLTGDVGPLATGATGILEVRVDVGENESFNFGGIDLGIRPGTPGVVRFTDASISEQPSTWSLSRTSLEDDFVGLFANSALGGGLPSGIAGVLFATIEYERIGSGSTTVFFEIGPESLVDGTPDHYPDDTNLTSDYAFYLSTIGPEPGDFDLDGDIDGQDFLVWQRNPSVGNLVDWQSNYSSSSLNAASSTVPEPNSLLLGFGTCVLLFANRQRYRLHP